MPIATRQPEATDLTTLQSVAVARRGDVESGVRSLGDLLPSGDPPAPAPVPAPARALALDALRLLPRLNERETRPVRWSNPAFGRDVEAIRTHLTPLRSRSALAASYGREAFHIAQPPADRDEPGPVRIAYALRWLELGDGIVGPTWPSMMGPCG